MYNDVVQRQIKIKQNSNCLIKGLTKKINTAGKSKKIHSQAALFSTETFWFQHIYTLNREFKNLTFIFNGLKISKCNLMDFILL